MLKLKDQKWKDMKTNRSYGEKNTIWCKLILQKWKNSKMKEMKNEKTWAEVLIKEYKLKQINFTFE